MFATPLFRTALLLLVSLLPFLASSRSIPRDQSLSTRDVSESSVTVNTVSSSGNHYPRGVHLSDGSVLIAYGYSDSTNTILQVLRSSDMGETFSFYGTISERESATADMDNVFLLEVGSTSPPTVLAAFRNHDKTTAGVYAYFRITVCRSVDGGKTWTFLSQAVEKAATADSTGFIAGIWEPFMRIGNDNNIQLTYSGELAKLDQQTFRTISSDGSSWSTPVNLEVHPSTEQLRDGMQGIIKTTDQADGREALVMVFESTPRTGLFSVIYAVSYDDGATYGDRATLYQPAASDRNAGSPQIINLPGGNGGLAVLFMTDEDVDTVSWPASAEVRTLSASAGLKGGQIQWGTSPELVGAANSHWPGLINYNGNILGLFDENGSIQGQLLSYS